ncbi:MAG: cytochrome P450 [Pseudomonadota bacterium]
MLDEARPQSAAARYEPPKIAPLPDDAPFLKAIRVAVGNPVASVPESAYRERFALREWAGRVSVHLCDPEILEEVLVRRWRDFPKSEIDARVFAPVLGHGLLTATGEDWRWKRRLAAPAFAPAALSALSAQMAAPFEAAAQAWITLGARSVGEGGAEIDVSAAMIQATLNVIERVLFADPVGVDKARMAEAIDGYLGPTAWMVVGAILGLPRWTPYPGKRAQARARDEVRALVRAAVLRRRAGMESGAPQPEDLTSALMAARDPETGRPLSDEDMVDMLLTLVAAGHETTAHSLTWTLYCLAHQPALQEELAAEARAAAGGGALTAEHLAELPRIEAALKETLRLFPVAPMLGRMSTQTERFDGFDLPKGAIVSVPIYALQRNSLYWDRPDAFDITRFLGRPDPPRTLYMPFGAGPRICIGMRLSMMESALGLAAMLRSVHFAPTAATECDPIHRVTLRPRRGLALRISRRADA